MRQAAAFEMDAAGVLEHLPMSECIGMMAKAMVAVSEGAASRPARTIMPLVDGSAYLGIMPGSLSSPQVYGVKVVSLHPANASAGRPTRCLSLGSRCFSSV